MKKFLLIITVAVSIALLASCTGDKPTVTDTAGTGVTTDATTETYDTSEWPTYSYKIKKDGTADIV